VVYDAAKSLINREPPEVRYVGIGLAVFLLIVMHHIGACEKTRGRKAGRVLPADAGSQVREVECFRQMTAVKSGMQTASAR